VLADGLRLKLIASLLVSGLLFALAPLVASAYGIHGLIWPVRGAAVFLFGQNVMLMGTAFMARGRTDLEWRTMLLESAVQTTATVALVLAGLGAAGAAFGQAIGYLAAAVLTVWLLVRLLGPAVLPRTVRFGVHTRRIATYAGVLLIVDGAYSAFSALDGLIIAAYRHTGEVAIFTAPMKLTAFLAYPAGALAAGVAPRLARSPGTEPNVGAFLVGLRVLVIVQSAITAFVLGWAPFAVSIALGSDYRASGAVLRALTPYIFLLGFGTLVSLGANYLGEARRRIPIAIATVVINVVVDLLLVPKIGALGACWGTDAAYALYAPAQLLICRRALGADLRPLVGTLARTLVAAAAMTAILLAFGSSLAHFWWPALGGLCGSAAFAAILWLSGEVSSDEVRSLLAAVPRPGRRA
jgi:O-antigen/teichoic acid export membrane protein